MYLIKNSVFLSCAILFFCQCGTSKITRSQDGKCYGKSMMPDIYAEYHEEEFLYTGDPIEERIVRNLYKGQLEWIVDIDLPASQKWVKKKSVSNCQSANPEDCLVWCLVDEPAAYKAHIIVVDTMAIKEFEIQTITRKELIEKGGTLEFVEVLCGKDVNETLVKDLQETLFQLGYLDKEMDGKLNSSTREALMLYQYDMGLPQGNLDMETLTLLGVLN